MCGRFTNQMSWREIHDLYSIHTPTAPGRNLRPGFNIAPTVDVAIAHLDKEGEIELDLARWWLVPHWAREIPKATLFNARIETVAETPAFRDAFKYRRCLIPADGYFEWTTSAEDGRKDPWLLQLPEGKPFSFAGLWAHNDNLGITSCTIITAPAVPAIEQIHNRMPVILAPESYSSWLDIETKGNNARAVLVDGQIDDQLVFHRVSRNVNNSRYEGSDTKEPIVNSL